MIELTPQGTDNRNEPTMEREMNELTAAVELWLRALTDRTVLNENEITEVKDLLLDVWVMLHDLQVVAQEEHLVATSV